MVIWNPAMGSASISNLEIILTKIPEQCLVNYLKCTMVYQKFGNTQIPKYANH